MEPFSLDPFLASETRSGLFGGEFPQILSVGVPDKVIVPSPNYESPNTPLFNDIPEDGSPNTPMFNDIPEDESPNTSMFDDIFDEDLKFLDFEDGADGETFSASSNLLGDCVHPQQPSLFHDCADSIISTKRVLEESACQEEQHGPAVAGAAKKLKRGEHVKGRREMQENARLGQRHWAAKVLELRDEWNAKQIGSFDPQFERQVWMCERARAKPQRECILLALQIATVEGVISPYPFSEAQDSLGWTGFWVNEEQSSEFRSRMSTVFPTHCQHTTINNTFRRCGLIADGSWDRAWRGLSPFVYQHQHNP